MPFVDPTDAQTLLPLGLLIRDRFRMGHEEIAAALGITVYLARQKWTYARAWLRDALGG